VLPRSYAETSTSLGYALTVFRSQGITVDHTFGLGGDSLFQEAGYTQLSRGRLSNNLYVASPENPRWEIGHHADDLAQRDALESLVDALSRNREQTMAQDRLPTWPAVSPDDLGATYRQHAALARWLTEHAPVDVTDQLAAASDRAHQARTTGRDTRGPMDDVPALVSQQRHRDEWVARHEEEIATWSRLEREVQRYEYRLGQAATYSRPGHVTALLGPLPERVGHVERWQAAAGAIEAYRSRWNLTGTATVGPEPADPEQRTHWRKTVAVVGAAGYLTRDESFGDGSERSSLTSHWEVSVAADLERGEEQTVPSASTPAATRDRDRDFSHSSVDSFGL
ncbi:MAG TPA: hypothetical protein VNG12_00290, partial [Acidimicrobiales bacterium]|nr:hypothetical protein [Acidimicrobiales bacterium]